MNELAEILLAASAETLYMTALASLVAAAFGVPLGIYLTITAPAHFCARERANSIANAIVNMVRSFPSLILIVLLLPLSRFLVGTTLGPSAAIVPLSVEMIPFLARVVENALNEIEKGKIEAAISMGASPTAIVWKVMLPEALPSLIRGATLATISMLGLTAIAGTIGAGGLGSLAIRYGYQRFRTDVMLSTVAILATLVFIIQFFGNRIASALAKSRHISA